MTTRIGLVAGEPSGDLLAARMMAGLTEHIEQAQFEGIGGPAMRAQDLSQWYPMDALSVFGYVDALKRLPGLLHTYSRVRSRWLKNKPDVFVGIDAPDFNLRLEKTLKQAGVPTVHFVGPSIWAWRYSRIHTIRESVSHMLVLFPFETELYEREGIPVTFVGHPLADQIPDQPDRRAAQARLGLDPNRKVLAVLPGSRASEVRLLSARFLQAVRLLQKQSPDLQIVVPMVNQQRRREFEAIAQENAIEHLLIIDQSLQEGRPAAWEAMEAADAVLVASGTATLEAALFKRPMVISYVLSPMMRRLMAWKSGQEKPYVPWVGLPNVLLQDFVVPELLQDDATPVKLAEACWNALSNETYVTGVEKKFEQLHQSLKCDTPKRAANAILKVLSREAGTTV
jgi:lipid-A-disaccharide synthase